MGSEHRCDEWCTCHTCGGPLLYAPAHDKHACADTDCVNVHGCPTLYERLWERPGMYVPTPAEWRVMVDGR